MSREGRRRWDMNSTFWIGKPGNPMLKRWRLLQTPLFGVYMHFIYREDLDRVPHDHPWNFWSLVLRGGYTEELHINARLNRFVYRERVRGSLHKMRASSAHRIIRVHPRTVTLVVVGRKQQTWGFWEDGIWTDYRKALGLRPVEGVSG